MSNVIKADAVLFQPIEASPVDPVETVADEENETTEGQSAPEEADRNDAVRTSAQMMRFAREEALSLLFRAEAVAMEKAAAIAKEQTELAARYDRAYRRGEEAGFAAGYEEGREAGSKKGFESYQELATSVEQLADQFREKEAGLMSQFKQEIVVLAVALAEKLVAKSLSDETESALEILNSLLPQVEGSTKAIIKLPASTFESLADQIDDIDELNEGEGGGIQFVLDSSLEHGDVVIETDWGLVDGRLRSRWHRILAGLDLRGELDGGSSGV